MLNRGPAQFRYRIARVLLIYGLIALSAGIPLFVLTWGRPEGSWALIYFFSGLIALAATTALSALNLIYIRQNARNPQSSRDLK